MTCSNVDAGFSKGVDILNFSPVVKVAILASKLYNPIMYSLDALRLLIRSLWSILIVSAILASTSTRVFSQIVFQPTTGSGSSGLTIGTTTISGGGTNAILYGNGTVLQNNTGVTSTGTGTLTFATSVISPLYTGAAAIAFRPGSDSTTAIRMQNATGSTTYFTLDTSTPTLVLNIKTSVDNLQANSTNVYGLGNATGSANSGLSFSNAAGVNWASGTAWFNAPDTNIFRCGAGCVGIGKGAAVANGTLNLAGATFFDPTATTGATRVLVSLGAADSTTTSTFTNAGTSSSVGVIVSGQPATTGQRFACLTTTGQIVSSVTACVGT